MSDFVFRKNKDFCIELYQHFYSRTSASEQMLQVFIFQVHFRSTSFPIKKNCNKTTYAFAFFKYSILTNFFRIKFSKSFSNHRNQTKNLMDLKMGANENPFISFQRFHYSLNSKILLHCVFKIILYVSSIQPPGIDAISTPERPEPFQNIEKLH